MSDLIVAKFKSPKDAFAARAALHQRARHFDIEPQDIEIVTRNAQSRVAVIPEVNTGLAQMIGGAIWGAVLGSVFLMPVIGAGVGAAVGFITGRATDIGINRHYLSRIGRDIAPGQAALALLARKVDTGALSETLKRYGGKVVRTTLSKETSGTLVTSAEATADATAEKADRRDQPPLA